MMADEPNPSPDDWKVWGDPQYSELGKKSGERVKQSAPVSGVAADELNTQPESAQDLGVEAAAHSQSERH